MDCYEEYQGDDFYDSTPEWELVRERVVVRFDTTLWRISLYKNEYGELYTYRTPLTPSCWDGSDIPF